MSKEVTIYDIAKELKLSAATVSRGLKSSSNIKKSTTKRILDKAEELGYRHNNFASNLRKQKSHTIGVLLHELNSNFITSVLAGIENVTREAGYDIIIAHSGESYDKEIANVTNLFHKRVDGLIASLAFGTKNLDHFKLFFEKKIPVIFFDRVDENSENTHVIIDNNRCGYLATQHLIEQGCKRIVMLTADLKRNVYEQRHRGYKDALYDAGIEYNKNLVMVKDLSEESAIEAAHAILKMKPRPDGLFVTNDFIAAVCMQELKRNGMKVPEDIAIVGFNNDAISKIIEPQLSTIDYPGKDMGEITARNLIGHLKGASNINITNRIIIKSALIVRDSSLRKK
ncbi:MAG TPA: LacI family DNA-binding transcriptional regulator [Ferruginibacter sp.]|nr:LacI family DNA-binding transcriptional regulator [Ferruginibacter sp.]HPH89337.1 LacI family DNA-binding transcriptional regulator [Ferruginibacter sp.]